MKLKALKLNQDLDIKKGGVRLKNNKKVKQSPFIILFFIITIILTACSSTEQQQFQFPIQKEDVEKVIADKELNWFITNVEYDENSKTVFTLENNEDGTVGIGTYASENGKSISLHWVLPKEISSGEVNKFYQNELPKLFDIVSTFYGSSKQLENGINEFYKYYLRAEDNLEGAYWTKRIGDDHLWIDVKTNLNSKYRILGTVTITSSKLYENYLKSKIESLKNLAKVDSIETSVSTVGEILEFVPPDDVQVYYSKFFSLQGHLEDIKEIKTVPESLKNLKSKFLKPNRDQYLMAKLVDDTGSVDVFLQTTSLNKEELGMERIHSVILLYYDNNPILIVLNSALIE